jgi:hypothetical protein
MEIFLSVVKSQLVIEERYKRKYMTNANDHQQPGERVWDCL